VEALTTSAERDENSVELQHLPNTMSPSDLVTENDRLLSWVQENKNGGDSSEVGLASSLYKACLRTLGMLSKQYVASRKPSRESKARIVESHARLCLFGDELLHEGALEHCLKGDHDLRDEVIGLLYCLGKTLLRGMFAITVSLMAQARCPDSPVRTLC